MRINNLTKLNRNGKFIVSADILYKGNSKKTVYFSVEEKYENCVNFDYSCFLAVAFMPAMKIGEDIYIEGSVSELLFFSLEKIMNTLVSWDAGFNSIKIYSEAIAKDKLKGNYIGSFFSGGVDSFYTLLKNSRETKGKISHLILMHGFDIHLNDTRFFNEVLENTKNIANAQQVEVLAVESNFREFIDELIDWGFGHGGALASAALLLRGGFKKVYIPSSHSYNSLYPMGSRPDLDPLWASENLEIIHDGANITRAQKTIKYIAKSEIALKYLRVCWKNVKGKYNCGVCPKCVRTMIDLRIAGVLDSSEAFNKKLDLRLFNTIDARRHGDRIFLKQSLGVLQKANKDPELQAAIKQMLYENTYNVFVQKARDFLARVDRRYNKNRLYWFLSKRGFI